MNIFYSCLNPSPFDYGGYCLFDNRTTSMSILVLVDILLRQANNRCMDLCIICVVYLLCLNLNYVLYTICVWFLKIKYIRLEALISFLNKSLFIEVHCWFYLLFIRLFASTNSSSTSALAISNSSRASCASQLSFSDWIKRSAKSSTVVFKDV